MACPWCLSVYFGAVAVIARQRWPRAWGPMARILTFSAMTGLLAEARTRATDKAAAADEPTLVTTQDSRDDEKSISG